MSKYHSVATVVDNITFASKKEARRYQELCLLVKAGEISDLELQPTYPLVVRNNFDPLFRKTIGKYTADFRYLDVATGLYVVEDVKSTATKTTAYRLRKKFVEAQYNIRIQEV